MGYALLATAISSQQVVLIAVIVAASVLMLVSTARRLRDGGGPSPRAYAREQVARLREERGVHDDIAEVMTQLQLTAREINAQLDAKFIRLERSIRDADERLASLDRVSRAAAGGSTLDVTVGPDSTCNRSGAAPGVERERIGALAASGMTPGQIAQETGVPRSEVELALAVHESVQRPMHANVGAETPVGPYAAGERAQTRG